MHFTTLFILKNETLESTPQWKIEEIFQDRFCYCCGETKPKYKYWCDWFKIGGRWCDLLKAKKGLYGERSWTNTEETPNNGMYSIVEIKDLTEDLPIENIYAIATKSHIYLKNADQEYNNLVNKINNKQINGVITLIDCHD
jgi:hypothetical protein